MSDDPRCNEEHEGPCFIVEAKEHVHEGDDDLFCLKFEFGPSVTVVVQARFSGAEDFDTGLAVAMENFPEMLKECLVKKMQSDIDSTVAMFSERLDHGEMPPKPADPQAN